MHSNISVLSALCALVLAVAPRAAPAATSAAVRGVDQALTEQTVGGTSLRGYLSRLEAQGCLAQVEQDLVAALDAVSDAYEAALTRHPEAAVQRGLRALLSDLSSDGALLLASWLDDRDRARRRWLCKDGLPRGWADVSPERYVDQAGAWFELSIREELGAQSAGSRTPEESAERLAAERDDLLARFDATFRDDRRHERVQVLLEARLAALWSLFVTPMLRSGLPRGEERPAVELEANPFAAEGGARRIEDPMSSVPPVAASAGGVDLSDPRALQAAEARQRRWAKQLKRLRGRAHGLGVGHDRLFAPGGEEEASARVIEGSTLETRLALLLTDVAILERQIRRGDPDSAVVRALLGRSAPEALGGAAQLREQIEACLHRLSNDLRRELDEHPVWLGSTAAAARIRLQGGATPRWYGVLRTDGEETRTYDGPLLPPSDRWSDRTVEAIRARHPGLDDVDARILLTLVAAVLPELSDAAEVELAVRSALLQEAGLGVTAAERELSELWAPGRPADQQPSILFEVKTN